MEEEDDPGMGVVKRRRSRRLLETRKVLDTPSEERVTTESAAAAWGDMLLGGAPEASSPPAASEPPRAPLRGVPLSSRPPSAAPPEVQFEEALRGSSRSLPPSPRDPVRSDPVPSHPVRSDPVRSDPARSDPVRPALVRPASVPSSVRPDPARPEPVRALPVSAAPRSAQAPDTGPPARKPPPVDDGPLEAPPVTRPNLRVPAALPPEPPPEPAESTLEVPAARPLGPRLVVAGLFLAAAVFTGAVLFDAMGRTDRLDRVGRALSTAGQRMLRDHPGLPGWVGPSPDPVSVKSLKEKEIPRLVEAVAAAGYTAGVFSVSLNEDPARARLVVEARVPDAVVAWATDGQWVHPPPATGLGAAFAGHFASILGAFAVPGLVWVTFLVRDRRRLSPKK